MDTLGKVVGLLVFVVGIALLGHVFYQATVFFDDVYRSARGEGSTLNESAKTQAAQENIEKVFGQGTSPLVAFAIAVGVRLIYLLVAGFLGSLIAAKGAQLCGAFRGKQETV